MTQKEQVTAVDVLRIIEDTRHNLDRIQAYLTPQEEERLSAEKVKVLLSQNGLPTAEDFIKDLINTCNRKSIHMKQFEEIIKAVVKAGEKTQINDVKKYIFRCINKTN